MAPPLNSQLSTLNSQLSPSAFRPDDNHSGEVVRLALREPVTARPFTLRGLPPRTLTDSGPAECAQEPGCNRRLRPTSRIEAIDLHRMHFLGQDIPGCHARFRIAIHVDARDV